MPFINFRVWIIVLLANMSSISAPNLVATGFEFPEGPAWDGKKNLLYCSNCYGDWIGLVSSQGTEIFSKASKEPFTFNRTNGLTLDHQGNLYACDFGIGAILRMTPSGKSTILADGYEGVAFNRPNDLAFSPLGDLYFTDPHHYTAENPDGTVYKIDMSSETVKPVVLEMAFPNGIAFSPDGKYAYICESAKQQVTRFHFHQDGTLSDPRLFVNMPGGDPDGIAFDQKGNLYVAHFGGGAVYQFDTLGRLIKKIKMPGAKPTNLEFGGADLHTLFITEVETQSIYSLQVDVPGFPLYNSPIYKEKYQ